MKFFRSFLPFSINIFSKNGNIITSSSDSDIIDLQKGALKDDNTLDNVELANETNQVLTTDDKTIVGAINELKDITDAISGSLIFKGSISVASDFPLLASVQNGWLFAIEANVTDNDVSKTNTGQSFIEGDQIAWNGTNWSKISSAIWKENGSDILPVVAGSSLNLSTGGLKDVDVTVSINLGDPSNTSFSTTNKTIVGSANELNTNKLNKSGSLADITTRNHSDLQNKNTETDIKHVTDDEKNGLDNALIAITGSNPVTDITTTKDLSNRQSTGVCVSPEPEFTDNGDGTATLSATTVLIYNNPNFTGELLKFDVESAILTFTDGAEEYTAVDYNSGTPIYKVVTTEMNNSNIIPINAVWRVGNVLHSVSADSLGLGLANKLNQRMFLVNRYERKFQSGLIISETTSPNPRTITCTESIVFTGAVPQVVSSFTSATDTMTECTITNGVWSYSNKLVYNNTQYNPPTGPTAILSNKYVVRWFYRSIGDVKQMFYVLGTNQYTSSTMAEQEPPRTDLPSVLIGHCMLVGRAIYQEGQTSGTTTSTFSLTFASVTLIDHNLDTTNKQGGTTNQYYHLTEANHESLTNVNAQLDNLQTDGTPTFNGVKSTDGLTINKASGNGIKVDTDTPTFGWRDLRGFMLPDTVGLNAPTLSTFIGGSVRRFAYTANDKMDLEFHIDHDYAMGTDTFIHIHWGHNGTAISGNFVVSFVYTYAKGFNQGIFSAEKTVTMTYNTVNIATTPRYAHRIDEIQLSSNGGSATLLDSALIEPDGVIGVNMTVTSTPTITGGSPNEPFIFFCDIHYQSTNIGTKQKAPNFYV